GISSEFFWGCSTVVSFGVSTDLSISTDFTGFFTDFTGVLTDFTEVLTDFTGFAASTDFTGVLTDFTGFAASTDFTEVLTDFTGFVASTDFTGVLIDFTGFAALTDFTGVLTDFTGFVGFTVFAGEGIGVISSCILMSGLIIPIDEGVEQRGCLGVIWFSCSSAFLFSVPSIRSLYRSLSGDIIGGGA
ncbi:MAG: hypothetical protein ABW168_19690, partial [Sedimenticola sp.]